MNPCDTDTLCLHFPPRRSGFMQHEVFRYDRKTQHNQASTVATNKPTTVDDDAMGDAGMHLQQLVGVASNRRRCRRRRDMHDP